MTIEIPRDMWNVIIDELIHFPRAIVALAGVNSFIRKLVSDRLFGENSDSIYQKHWIFQAISEMCIRLTTGHSLNCENKYKLLEKCGTTYQIKNAEYSFVPVHLTSDEIQMFISKCADKYDVYEIPIGVFFGPNDTIRSILIYSTRYEYFFALFQSRYFKKLTRSDALNFQNTHDEITRKSKNIDNVIKIIFPSLSHYVNIKPQ
jgi:hypothetical protein